MSAALLSWVEVLARLTGQEQTELALACSGRKYADLEYSLGLLTAYVPVTVEVAQAQGGEEQAQALEARVQETRRWQEYFSWEQWRGGARHGAEGQIKAPQ